jgi:hypothetical protein
MTHLILHKVRGEPAFDVAEKIQIGDEEGWIIPTSGHRAYPVKTWRLNHIIEDVVEVPEDWPDHYPMDTGHAPPPNFNVMAVISNLVPKIKRRL